MLREAYIGAPPTIVSPAREPALSMPVLAQAARLRLAQMAAMRVMLLMGIDGPRDEIGKDRSLAPADRPRDTDERP
jgi:hypothetical protein